MGLAPEDQLLVQCSRVTMDEEAIAAASNLLQQDLDWAYIVESSIRHGVSPLLHHGLRQVAETVAVDGLIPSQVREELHNLYRGNRSRNQRLYRVIKEIAGAFEQAGIALMGLKDLQLGWEVYPDVGLRPMGDIDLLIHRKDYEQTAACMATLGFVPLPSPDIPFTRKYAWAHHFHRPSDDVWVDMQWNVLQLEWDNYGEGDFDFEIDRMWRGANFMAVEDSRILVPGPEDMLFHLCLHLEGHRYAELILFCDIVELLRHWGDRLDWQYLVGITKKYRVESSVYYVPFLAQRLFKIDLPPFLWQELEPDYHKADIFEALFGNLTTLHISLDEIRQAAFPPDGAMAGFEATVRLQAAAAMQLYQEIDRIASAFVQQGGQPVILDGAPSERIFADPLLRPFEEVRIFVLGRDLPHLHQVLSGQGFKDQGIVERQAFEKEREIVSRDPALTGRRARLLLRVEVGTKLDSLFEADGNGHGSKKEIALELLKARLAGRQGVPGDIPVQIRIMALTPEDMLVYLSARLGKQEQNCLFGLNSLLEFFRCYSGPVDWGQVARKSQQYGISGAVGEGLLIADELLDDDQLPSAALALCAGSASQPRIFELARYGQASLGLYTDLKPAFLYLFTLLSLDGLKAKSKYLLRSLSGYQGYRPVLPRLVLETGAGMIAQIRKRRQHPTPDLAFWVERGVRSETVSQNDGQA